MLPPKPVIFGRVYIRISELGGNNFVFTSVEWIENFPSLIYLKDDSNVHRYCRGFHVNLSSVYHFYNLLSCCMSCQGMHGTRQSGYFILLWGLPLWLSIARGCILKGFKTHHPILHAVLLEWQSTLPVECNLFPQGTCYSSLLAFVSLRAQWVWGLRI